MDDAVAVRVVQPGRDPAQVLQRCRAVERAVVHPVGEAAAVGVRSPVGDRGEEAVQQKAVGAQQLDQIET